eukprot:TRINITY_DN7726_c1_g1_i1.p1 TRINITY_DN7726_c1_g1~~TRINITY_DN7726_c1_g1_i1.p1  ORF type:complete len:393 (-),score=55.33 TRINITY_DN7726_c1_g1_i1:145-1323(-)
MASATQNVQRPSFLPPERTSPAVASSSSSVIRPSFLPAELPDQDCPAGSVSGSGDALTETVFVSAFDDNAHPFLGMEQQQPHPALRTACLWRCCMCFFRSRAVMDANETSSGVSLPAIDSAGAPNPSSQKGAPLIATDDAVQVANPTSCSSNDATDDSDVLVQFCTAAKQMHSKEPDQVTAEDFRRVVKYFGMVLQPSKELENMIFYFGNQWSVKVGPSANRMLPRSSTGSSRKDPKFRELNSDVYESIFLLSILRSEPKKMPKHPAEGVRWAADVLEFVGRVLMSFIGSCTSPARGSSFLDEATWDVLLGKLPPTADGIQKSFEGSALQKTLASQWLARPVSWALGGKKPRLIIEPLADNFKRSVSRFVDFAKHVEMAAQSLDRVHHAFAT